MTNGAIVSSGSRINSNSTGWDKEALASVKPGQLNPKHVAMLFPHTGRLIHSLRSDKVRALPSLRWCDSGEGVLFPSFKHPWKPAGLWVITGTMIDRSVSPSWAIQFPLSTQPAAHCSSQTDSTCDTAGRTAQRLLRASPHLTQFLHPSYSYTSQIIKKWVWFFSQFFFFL